MTLRGVISVTEILDTLGAMSRSVEDVLALSEIILGRGLRGSGENEGVGGERDGEWEGLRIGFLDAAVWRLPESLCERDERAVSQMVRPSIESWVRWLANILTRLYRKHPTSTQ